ncbi:ATP-binding protein [Kitasatospora sp. MAP5-34]|uniref:ATP-binding protein n=1 Tax=Kitasatospora sp. MAP5-34 TaxID=3035102 RepID=UPI0024742FEA|nr:ATP-binding protein [Kitasatospora sp. MAP5-34]MDH6577470.1 serine/threonine-protein kinase RsbW [Kitasatospora sp. MAP5-34]
MDIWWTLHLKRDPASVPLARRILLGAMDSAGVDPQVSYDLGIALTEACANAVEHAVGGRPDEGFQVTASISGDRLRIEVIDSGPGLPSAVPAAPQPPLPRLRRQPVPSVRPGGRNRTRRGRATLPAPALTAARPRSDRPAPYDTHVLSAVRPTPTATCLPDLDTLPDLNAESGRGLFLIHALTDHVQLRNHPLRGAIVSFDKVLKWQDDAALRLAS